MDNEKMYQLLSSYMDDELSPDKKLKAIELLDNNPNCQDELRQLQNLKQTLSTAYPELTTSPSFEANLKIKIQEQENKLTWFQRFLESKLFHNLSYAAVAASILFIAFLGFQVYLNSNEPLAISTNTPDLTQTNTQPVLGIQNFHGNALSSRVSNNNESILSIKPCPKKKSSYILTIKKGPHTINIDLTTGKPYRKEDRQKLQYFKALRERDIKEFHNFINKTPLFARAK